MHPSLIPLIVGLLSLAQQSPANSMEDLISDLLVSYDARAQPIQGRIKYVDVTIDYVVAMIHSYDDVRSELTFLGRIEANWYDPRLQWNISDYDGIEMVILPKTDVWCPSFDMPSSVRTNELPGSRASKARVTFDGTMQFASTDLLTITCSADVQDYPHDVQSCKASMMPDGYIPFYEVNFAAGDYSFTSMRVENSEWKVNNISNYASRGEFVIEMTIERRNTFPLMTMSIPMYVLCAINPSVFLLPTESGERISFSVTTTLAFTVYISILSDKIPAGSDPVASLVIEVFTMLLYSVFILLATIISLRFYHNAERVPVSRWAQYLTSASRCRLCCRCKPTGQVPSKNKIAAVGDSPAGKHDDNLEDGHVKSRPEETVTWYDVSRTFDSLMLIFCYALFAIQMLTFHA